MTIDHHALLSLVILMLNAQNGIGLTKKMQLEKLCRLIHNFRLQSVDWSTYSIVNGSSSCINLIFTSNTSLVTDFGVNPRLYKTCHHNLIFGKINFNIPLLPPFYRGIWDYKRAIVEIAQKAITNFNWKQAFSNSSVSENVRLFGDTLKNIFSNYIPNRRIKIDYRKPKWMTPKTFAALRKRSKLSKSTTRIHQW